jgi:hypothetical protein
MDLTTDVTHGYDAMALVETLVASRDSRIKYIIWNRKIINSRNQPRSRRNYTGVIHTPGTSTFSATGKSCSQLHRVVPTLRSHGPHGCRAVLSAQIRVCKLRRELVRRRNLKKTLRSPQ